MSKRVVVLLALLALLVVIAACAPAPFAPLGFSAVMERVLASARRFSKPVR